VSRSATLSEPRPERAGTKLMEHKGHIYIPDLAPAA